MTGPAAGEGDFDRSRPDDSEPVGSIAEEAFRLFRAFTAAEQPSEQSSGDENHSDAHVCSTGWCPVCQVVGFVKQNPAAVAAVTHTAVAFAQSLSDLVDAALAPQEEK